MTDLSKVNSSWPASHIPQNMHEFSHLNDNLLPFFKSLFAQEQIELSSSFLKAIKQLYIPFCAWLSNKQKNEALIIGINGSQGSGKSTLTKILSLILEQGFNKKVVSFSIDDLYKSSVQRQELAKTVHPLLATRGAPGTHDVDLGISILNHIRHKNPAELLIPEFDKSLDDRLPVTSWKKFTGTCDIVLFEGWCVGAIAQEKQALITPVNELEKKADPDGVWRRYTNNQLNEIYSDLFSLIDILVMLKIPDFNKVYEWRKLQEHKLRTSTDEDDKDKNKTMTDLEVENFIMHYERITRHTLNEMPERSDIVFELGNNHQVKNIITRCEA